MSCFRLILAIILPPLAVLDKGLGTVILVTILACFGWVPAVIAALIIISNDR